MKEIEDIKSGKWDSNLKAKISGVPEATAEKEELVRPLPRINSTMSNLFPLGGIN